MLVYQTEPRHPQKLFCLILIFPRHKSFNKIIVVIINYIYLLFKRSLKRAGVSPTFSISFMIKEINRKETARRNQNAEIRCDHPHRTLSGPQGTRRKRDPPESQSEADPERVSRDRTNARGISSLAGQSHGINARTISTPSHHMHRLYQYYAQSFLGKMCPTKRNCCVCNSRDWIPLTTEMSNERVLFRKSPTKLLLDAEIESSIVILDG